MRIDINTKAKRPGGARAFIVQLFALCLLCASNAAAQDSRTAEGGAQKWDEYGRVGHCDLGARLDNFASFLQENREAVGYVVSYDPVKGSPGIAKRSAEMQVQYLVYSRGIAAERLVAVGAGRHQGSELKTELWIVPPGAQAPVEAPSADGERPYSGKFATFWMNEDSSFDHSEEMGGPGSMWITRQAFADLLKRQPESKAYLVAYAKGDLSPGAWRRFASSEKLQLEELGVDPSRLSVVNGGERKESEVELWITPGDAPPPVKPKKREKRLREAAMIGAYTHFDWKQDAARERRWMLDNLAEMLREDSQRVGCLIVFPGDGGSEFDESTGKVETPFDYGALAGEWRRELTERYGIEAHRVVLLVGQVGEWPGSGVETWIVPKGVALPDPAEIVKRREAEMNAEGELGDAAKP
jgi:hypothetical protein